MPSSPLWPIGSGRVYKVNRLIHGRFELVIKVESLLAVRAGSFVVSLDRIWYKFLG
jgi:hypothetical protein